MKKSITRDEWNSLILLLAIVLGAFMRFHPAMTAGFAINDGGMFVVMMDDLKASHFRIPVFTSYNHLNIPFAYPLLGLYLGAILSSIFRLTSIQIVQWLPAFFASLSIPVFYSLALKLLKNKFHASLSTLIFALMPRAFQWFIMGGGLTRAPGQFFMLLALVFLLRLYDENRRVDLFIAGLFSGLAVLSHPETAVHTVLTAVLFWLVLSRRRNTFVQSVLVAVIVLIVTAPWWMSVLHYHGIAPLLSAMQTGGNSLAIFHLLFFVFTEEPYATVIAVLALIGIARRLIQGDYLLPLWMLIPFLLAGRSATSLAAIPLSMLAAAGLAEVVFPALPLSVGKESEPSRVTRMEGAVLIYLSLYLLFSTYQFGFQFSSASLSISDREAMTWARLNTREDSRFLVLTGADSVACDAVSEWFPALSGRQSVSTIQGREWTLGKRFGAFITESVGVQACVNREPSCLEDRARPVNYEYVYVVKRLNVNNCVPLHPGTDHRYFIEHMRTGNTFDAVYENDGVIVFAKR